MRLATRTVALFAVVGLLASTGCKGNKDKIVGKWKMESMTDKDGKEQKMNIMGMTPMLEFTADGNVNVGMDMSGLSEDMKKAMEADKEKASEVGKMQPAGKYTVSGDTIELTSTEKGAGFGKKDKVKGKLKIDGDTLTITGDDGTLKLTRVK